MTFRDELKALATKAIRTGPMFYWILGNLQKSQEYTWEQLREYQETRLQKIVHHCYLYVPYYRELFDRLHLKPSDIRTVSDLEKLPLMDKETVRRHFKQLVSTKRPLLMNSFVGYTSGSTGSPAHYLRDFYSVNFENAAAWRFFRMHGQVGYRQIQFSGRLLFPKEQTRPPFWKYNLANDMLVFSSFHMSRETIPAYVQAIRQFRPRVVHGWPSSLYQFAELLEETGLKLDLDVIVVMTSSETVFDYQRETIERVFGARLRDWYGQQERVSAIGQCEYGTYHIQEDYSITELVQTDHGLEIVGSHLFNYRMPLLRYRTGDYAIPSEKKDCPCGRQFRTVESIAGRAYNQYILTPDGRKISVLNGMLLRIPHLKETQIVQEGLRELVINVAVCHGFGEAEERLLLERARAYIGADMDIQVRIVPQIPRSPSGKYQFIVNRLTQPERQPEAV